MKVASVADLRNNFSSVSRWIYEGESVTIKKRGRVFAVLTPVQRKKSTLSWPAFEKRLRRIFPNGSAKGASSEETVDAMRGDY